MPSSNPLKHDPRRLAHGGLHPPHVRVQTSSGAQISTASCTGAQTSMPRSVPGSTPAATFRRRSPASGNCARIGRFELPPAPAPASQTPCAACPSAWRDRRRHRTSARKRGRFRDASRKSSRAGSAADRSAAPRSRPPCRTARRATHALNCSRTGLVRRLGRVRGRRTGLFGEGKIGVARAVGVQHQRVAGQRRGDAELLLRPIDIGHARSPGTA